MFSGEYYDHVLATNFEAYIKNEVSVNYFVIYRILIRFIADIIFILII